MTSLNDRLDEAERAIRAEHPDAGRLLDGLREQDTTIELAIMTGAPDEETVAALGELVDQRALYVVGMLRAAEVMTDFKPSEFLANPQETLAAVWADGVLAGVQFQRAGGAST